MLGVVDPENKEGRYLKIDVDGSTARASGSAPGMSIIRSFRLQAACPISSICLPSKLTYDILKAIRNDTVTIERLPDANVVMLKSGRFEAALPTIPNKDFEFPNIDEKPETRAVLDTAHLKTLISRVADVAPKKEGRFGLNQIQLESNGTSLRAVATDSARMVIADAPFAGNGIFTVFLQADASGAYRYITEITCGTVELFESSAAYFFKTAAEQLVVLKPSVKFPDYQKAISKASFTASLTVDSTALSSGIKRMLPVVDEDYPITLIEIRADELRLTTHSGHGRATVSVAIKLTGDHEHFNIHMNLEYVLDFLSQVEGEITLQFKDENSLVRLSSGDAYQHFIMPMHPRA